MIEMRVGAVTTHPQTGRSVALLQPCDAAGTPPLALGISRAEACSLSHELRSQATMRAQAYGLLARCLGIHATRLRAVRLLPAPSGMATARLELEWPDGEAKTTVEVGHGLGLAVALDLPLLVSEALLHQHATGSEDGARDPGDSGDPAATPDAPPSARADALVAVPAAFRRAFE